MENEKYMYNNSKEQKQKANSVIVCVIVQSTHKSTTTIYTTIQSYIHTHVHTPDNRRNTKSQPV